eukprot:scaffold6471_cov275-Prasinococcus_capsulatus_cf.AAC.1
MVARLPLLMLVMMLRLRLRPRAPLTMMRWLRRGGGGSGVGGPRPDRSRPREPVGEGGRGYKAARAVRPPPSEHRGHAPGASRTATARRPPSGTSTQPRASPGGARQCRRSARAPRSRAGERFGTGAAPARRGDPSSIRSGHVGGRESALRPRAGEVQVHQGGQGQMDQAGEGHVPPGVRPGRREARLRRDEELLRSEGEGHRRGARGGGAHERHRCARAQEGASPGASCRHRSRRDPAAQG